ncbi:MAG: hypothetical protein RIS84_25 [Pseudomonadota bacterium]|jgi:hypothetical protein
MYKLYYHALQKNDPVFFRSMLQLVGLKLSQNWEIDEHAKLVLVDVETPEGQSFWQNPPEGKVLIVYARQNDMQSSWFLPKPIRTQSLIQLLNELAEHVCFDNDAPKPPAKIQASHTDVVKAKASEFFQPEYYLVGVLQQILQSQEITRASCTGFPPLYIVPSERRCFTHQVQFNQINTAQKMFYAASIDELECETLSTEQLQQEIKQQHLVAYPVETMLWLSAMCASQGRFSSVGVQNKFIRLVQWPNFALFPYQPYHMNLAAYMLKNVADVHNIAQKTQCSLENVVDFTNACSIIGILKYEQEHKVVEKQLPEARRGLFKTILQRLADTVTFHK